jgi:hypothetical protein
MKQVAAQHARRHAEMPGNHFGVGSFCAASTTASKSAEACSKRLWECSRHARSGRSHPQYGSVLWRSRRQPVPLQAGGRAGHRLQMHAEPRDSPSLGATRAVVCLVRPPHCDGRRLACQPCAAPAERREGRRDGSHACVNGDSVSRLVAPGEGRRRGIRVVRPRGRFGGGVTQRSAWAEIECSPGFDRH